MQSKMAAPMLWRGIPRLSFFSRHFALRRLFSSENDPGADPPHANNDDINRELVDELLEAQGQTQDIHDAKPKLTGFAQAYEKHATLLDDSDERVTEKSKDGSPMPQESFATMFRNSTHVHIGSGKDQLVIGKIYHIVDDDLYIDFGGKFHCVCKKPENDPLIHKYQRGAKVRLRLHDVELAQHFIGATHDITLLEADATLLGLLDRRTPKPTLV